jgi:hypothetical protein
VNEFQERYGQGGAIRFVQWSHEVAVDALDVRPDGPAQGGLSGRREYDVDAASIGRAVLASDQSGLDHAVHQPGDAARGQRHLRAQPAHGEPTLFSAPDVDEHVKPDQGDPDRLFELAPQQISQASSIWASTPQVPPSAAGCASSSYSPCRGDIAVLIVRSLNLFQSYQELAFT